MRASVKLDFKPLSLEQTAKELGIPRKRALKIMEMFGVEGASRNGRRVSRRPHTAKTHSRSAKASR